jgi:hypothetical protein|tara:strand:+ start:183 stop:356 length:174 start_codon:yes stop_codon:yes gene_type:complete
LARGLFDAVEFQVNFFNVARSRFDFQLVFTIANNWDVCFSFISFEEERLKREEEEEE